MNSHNNTLHHYIRNVIIIAKDSGINTDLESCIYYFAQVINQLKHVLPLQIIIADPSR